MAVRPRVHAITNAKPSAGRQFLNAQGITSEQEDRSNKLLDEETQPRWLREISFEDVDC